MIKHELCHWRRRDNLTGAIHMIVTLLFWFHPLVWWIGRRLVIERERACDESVLASGNDPVDYAESILEICRFYARSPLVCAAGVAGANLKDRVERIIRNTAVAKVGLLKSLVLAGVAAGAVMIPLAAGLLAPHAQAQAAPRTLAPPAVAVKTQPRLATPIKPTPKPLPTTRESRPAAQVAVRAKTTNTAAYPGAAAAREAVEGAEGVEDQIAAATSADVPTPAANAPPPTEEIIVSSKRIRD